MARCTTCSTGPRRHQLGLRGQQQAQRDGQPNLENAHPLAYRHVRNDMVDQVGREVADPQAGNVGQGAGHGAPQQRQIMASIQSWVPVRRPEAAPSGRRLPASTQREFHTARAPHPQCAGAASIDLRVM